MKKIEFSYAMEIQFSQPALRHCFSLRCLPFDTSYQNIREIFVEINPSNCLTETTDGFGNRVLTDRIIKEHTLFSAFVSGNAEIDLSLREAEALNPIYKYPSKYTKVGDALQAFADAMQAEVQGKSDFEKAQFLMDQIYRRFSYKSGITNINTTAEEAFTLSAGVCQDYAHIFISICRKWGIPARYVVGIPSGEGETHAWAEIYYQGIWYGFDPTNHKLIDDTYLKLSHGRDFADCGVNRGIFIGGGSQLQTVKTTLELIDE